MRRLIFAATAVPLACLAVPALAQDTDRAPVAETEALDRMAQSLSDPVRQAQLAATLAALTEIVLDIPLAPIVEPLAEAAGEMAGEPSPRIDPDLTLRRMAPRSDDLSRTIQDRLPQAMDRMAGLSGSLAALVPALRDMAEQLEVALPPAESPPTR